MAQVGGHQIVASSAKPTSEQDEQDHQTASRWQDKLKETDGGRQRFLLELEFVQLLANPTYIYHLVQNRYFDDEAFVGYLNYLLYWKRPKYAKYVISLSNRLFSTVAPPESTHTSMDSEQC